MLGAAKAAREASAAAASEAGKGDSKSSAGAAGSAGSASGSGSSAHPQSQEVSIQVVAVSFSMVTAISSVRIFMPADVRHPAVKEQVMANADTAAKNFPAGLPLLQLQDVLGTAPASGPASAPASSGSSAPSAGSGSGSRSGSGSGSVSAAASNSDSDAASAAAAALSSAQQIEQRLRSVEARIAASPLQQLGSSARARLLSLHDRKVELQQRLKEARSRARKSNLVAFRQELANRMRVLRRLGHIDKVGPFSLIRTVPPPHCCNDEIPFGLPVLASVPCGMC